MSGTIADQFQNIFRKIESTATSAAKSVTSMIAPSGTNTKTGSIASIAPYSTGVVSNLSRTSDGLFSAAGIISLAGYLFSILAVVFIILLFVHYFITPVIQMRPGAPGYIYLGTDNGVLYWKDGYTPGILNKDTPIASMYYGYTLMVDIKLASVMPFGTKPRILLTRGALAKETVPDSAATLSSLFTSYNLAIALKPDTTDLIVSTMSKGNNEENIVLSNVPVNTTFRLVVVLFEKSMEVYVNGRLMRTRALSNVLLDVKGDINRSSTAEDSQVAYLRNLKIWPSTLPTSEIQGATPSMPAESSTGGSSVLPSMSSSCSPSS